MCACTRVCVRVHTRFVLNPSPKAPTVRVRRTFSLGFSHHPDMSLLEHDIPHAGGVLAGTPRPPPRLHSWRRRGRARGGGGWCASPRRWRCRPRWPLGPGTLSRGTRWRHPPPAPLQRGLVNDNWPALTPQLTNTGTSRQFIGIFSSLFLTLPIIGFSYQDQSLSPDHVGKSIFYCISLRSPQGV